MISAFPGSKFTRQNPASQAASGLGTCSPSSTRPRQPFDAMTIEADPGARTPQRDGIGDALAVAPALLVFGATLGILIRSTPTGDGAGLLGARARTWWVGGSAAPGCRSASR